MPSDDPAVLYLLMRTDLTSMNPGKACAQAHHAATLFAKWPKRDPQLHAAWLEEADGYGTVITLGCTIEQIAQALLIGHMLGYDTGMVTDPTYPIRDGQVTHLLPMKTCGFVLCRKSKASFLSHLQLMY